MSPIDIVLTRLDKVRQSGRDRWRAICPHCGGKNASALSIGIGSEDQVLLRCWKGCDVQNITVALGLEMTDLFPPRQGPGGGSGPVRKRLLPASQALDVLEAEMLVVVVTASDMAAGKHLGEGDLDRLMTAAARISTIASEVRT